MDIGYLLQGLYGDGARYIFETICAQIIIQEHNSIIKFEKSELSDCKREILKSSKEDIYSLQLPVGGNVFHVSVRRGDGGLDIIHEIDDNWIVLSM
ncbi:hypothetical protein KW850_05940 [Bacillus sp. sid0103]|uniref:hypothetical protein n=1 Tax=Bacillus sp. sid0103 TaxID=2856337 RepID=UPI001C47C962|nr:hypothetical protein [Bacillus sp. sid0103]MBV7504805.1 hypothetical protein [Bacillus sp. sid0103]